MKHIPPCESPTIHHHPNPVRACHSQLKPDANCLNCRATINNPLKYHWHSLWGSRCWHFTPLNFIKLLRGITYGKVYKWICLNAAGAHTWRSGLDHIARDGSTPWVSAGPVDGQGWTIACYKGLSRGSWGSWGRRIKRWSKAVKVKN